MKKKTDWRINPETGRPIRAVGEAAEGYIMVRHRGCMPRVVAERFWDGLEPAEPAGRECSPPSAA